jgi:peptidyl-prolyl cis-trans isomerase A (cyclophilin A)
VLAQVQPPVAADLAKYTKNIAGKGELLATIKTPMGTLTCQLLADKAPATVANFVGLATGQKAWLDPKTNKLQKNKPYYNGLIFHRVIPGFMIHGGDPTGTGAGGPGYRFADETSPDVKMAPGVLAMANSGPSTNGSQFFITDGTPSYLDGKHTIFGRCAPIDVVTKIEAVKRDASDRPLTPVTMQITISRGNP